MADAATRVTVRVRPRAGKSAIIGRRADGCLEVALRSAPKGGEANRELIGLLARALSVPRRAVTLVRGASARTKVVRVEGATPARVAALTVERTDQQGSER